MQRKALTEFLKSTNVVAEYNYSIWVKHLHSKSEMHQFNIIFTQQILDYQNTNRSNWEFDQPVNNVCLIVIHIQKAVFAS